MFNFNKIIKVLIISSVFVYSSWGLIMPVLAVFIVGSINGGDVGVAGMAVGIYWIVKSLIQIPIGKYLDRNHGEKDDYWFVVVGTFISSLTPMFLLISSEPWHIYALQTVHAIGMGMAVPPMGGIFMRHIDKGREAESFGFNSSAYGMGVGIAGIVGGFIAKTIGFAPLFIAVSILGMMGSMGILAIKENILPKKSEKIGKDKAVHVGEVGHM